MARIALLNEGLELAAHSDQNYDSALVVLRQGLEADRFGVVAHVFGQQPKLFASAMRDVGPLE